MQARAIIIDSLVDHHVQVSTSVNVADDDAVQEVLKPGPSVVADAMPLRTGPSVATLEIRPGLPGATLQFNPGPSGVCYQYRPSPSLNDR